MHPFILPHLMGGCTKHRDKRGLYFDSASSKNLSRVPAAAGNRRTWTFSVWVKFARFGKTYNPILLGGADGAGLTGLDLGNGVSRSCLRFYFNGTAGDFQTTAEYRDPTAWYHIVLAVDTTQAVAADRVKLYINGAQVTSFTSINYPAQNLQGSFNDAVIHRVGGSPHLPGYHDGGMAHLTVVDGQQLTPDAFSKVDFRTGSRQPQVFIGDHGLCGGYYPMVGDAGDAPATAAEGVKDRAPLGGGHAGANNWTANNFSASDFVKDTPTNFRSSSDYRGNMCVWNAVAPKGSVLTISKGGRRVAAGTTATNYSVPATFAMKKGRWYWESDVVVVGQALLGVAKADAPFNGNSNAGANYLYVYSSLGTVYPAGGAVAYGAAYGNGDRIGFLFDADALKLYVSKNGIWQGGSDPNTGAGGIAIASNPAGYVPYFESGSSGSPTTVETNFGQRDFVDPVPLNGNPLCASVGTASLAKTASAFVQAVDSGANISAALAAKRAGWGNSYIDIIKSLGVEGWRWRFGDDAGNYLDTTDNANGVRPFPALAGASYWACSIRVGPEYGVFTGVVVHVNGIATTVNDNAGTIRKAVILRRVDAGSNWPCFHPDASAGNLLYLNTPAAQAVAGDITNVAANSFQIGAAMPSGNYRYLVLAESPGLVRFTKHDGNSSNDGPVRPIGGLPGLNVIKLLTGGSGSWHTRGSARNPGNPSNAALILESTIQERTSDGSGAFDIDLLATGFKLRNARSDNNASGSSYVSISILEAIFAPGDCPAQATAR